MLLKSKKMKATATILLAVFVTAAAIVFPVAAAAADGAAEGIADPGAAAVPERVADWDGWTFDQSQYERFSPEWVEEVQNHIIDYRQSTLQADGSWDWMGQKYILGWDDRIGYAVRDGNVDYTTGTITYDWGLFGNLFGWGVPSQLFTTTDELDYFMNIYGANYSACHISIFPDEIEEMERQMAELNRPLIVDETAKPVEETA